SGRVSSPAAGRAATTPRHSPSQTNICQQLSEPWLTQLLTGPGPSGPGNSGPDDQPDRVGPLGGEPIDGVDHVVQRHDVGDRVGQVEASGLHQPKQLMQVLLAVAEVPEQGL